MIAALPAARPRRTSTPWPVALVVGLSAYLLARPVVAVIHELAILGAAWLFNQIHHGSSGWTLVRLIPGDPIYTGAVASLLSDMDAVGLALDGPLGALLHSYWPAVFLDPALIQDGAFVSALILPGSTLVARGLSFFLADVVVLALGWGVWLWATSGPMSMFRLSLALGTAAQQLHVIVHHHLANRVALRDLESLGIPFALSALQRGAPQDRPRVTAWLTSIPSPVIDIVFNSILATLAVAASLLIAIALRQMWRNVSKLLSPAPTATLFASSPRSMHRMVWIPALVLTVSPFGAVVDADSRVLGLVDESIVIVPGAEKLSLPSLGPEPAQTKTDLSVSKSETPLAPTSVVINGGDFHYHSSVNGEPSTIRGMGYNVRYAHLSTEERRALYDRDFALMSTMGVNTVVGWEAREFDELTLERAAAHGLGVVPPFEMRPDVDYTDEAVRTETMTEALAWVRRYKEYPAVRMWALGNEILHKLVFPSWMPVQAEPWREERARAFADLLVTMADRVRAEDPLHPVVYTDAEDAYVGYVREAILADGQPRPWFVYGINAYTPRLRSMIESWPSVGFDTPLFISEFAPGGLSAQDRPAGLRDMWDVVKSFDDRVLGGAVYSWTVEGPEEVDRVFGLVDANGAPVDGALNAVARMYGGHVEVATASNHDDAMADEDDPVQEMARTAFAAIQPELDEDAVSEDDQVGGHDAEQEPETPGGEMQVARVIDANTASADGQDSGDAWWVTWRSTDRRKRDVAMLVERGDDGQPRVSYVHRPKS